ncbi:hypothetical protein N7492_001502 [Penicillium capsulatum]|uniref:TauD/TfdA-like domain-containing protein n=1 Tax=Penicillium capsulatum TaxID=69766 RepID=A0A9W9IXV8_9EURO|nr:hypothetical protein N7492_001502 [Penicillium capsulatum]
MCKCPRCVDPHSKQRSFRTQDIPGNINASSTKFDGKTLEISWKSDVPGYGEDHVSRWDIDFFKEKVVKPRNKASSDMRALIWKKSWMEENQHWISYEDYINNEEKFAGAMQNLNRTGLIFVKDIPQSREMVEKIATRMGPLRNSFYGSTWDVRTVPQAKNVAYTNQFLGFHMDLLYMNEPPGYQLLHCLENSCEGGESLFVDTFKAAYELRQRSKKKYDILTQRNLAYEYRHENSLYYNEWPVIETSRFSKGLIDRVNYSPPFQSALPSSASAGKSVPWKEHKAFADALKTFSNLLERQKAIFELKLNPGECVIFANRRVAHARRQFNTSSGSRWLAGAYVDEDAVLSRIAVAQRKYPAAVAAANPTAASKPREKSPPSKETEKPESE